MDGSERAFSDTSEPKLDSNSAFRACLSTQDLIPTFTMYFTFFNTLVLSSLAMLFHARVQIDVDLPSHLSMSVALAVVGLPF
jgi:hypothetical protein